MTKAILGAIGILFIFGIIGWVAWGIHEDKEIEYDRLALNEIHEEHLRRMRLQRDPEAISDDLIWIAHWGDCMSRLVKRHNLVHPLQPWATIADDHTIRLVGYSGLQAIKRASCPPRP